MGLFGHCGMMCLLSMHGELKQIKCSFYDSTSLELVTHQFKQGPRARHENWPLHSYIKSRCTWKALNIESSLFKKSLFSNLKGFNFV
jgi:hypothetical protein